MSAEPSRDDDRLAEVLADFIDRINAGEFVDENVVCDEEPALAPEILVGADSAIQTSFVGMGVTSLRSCSASCAQRFVSSAIFTN